MPTTRQVYLGSRPLKSVSSLHHYAVKVGDTWYELEGASKDQSNQPNILKTHKNDEYTMELIGTTTKTDTELKEIIDDWLKKHPTYVFHQDNCQLFARDIIVLLTGKTISTENNAISFGLGIFGVCAAVLSAGAFAAAAIIRHP